jgi:hypothetical protein
MDAITKSSREFQIPLSWSHAEPHPKQALIAGPLRAELEGWALRDVAIAGHLTARQITYAVRDRLWRTIPGVVENARVDQWADRFAIDLTVHHRSDPIDLRVVMRIEGRQDGGLSSRLVAHPMTDFEYARIGHLILLPSDRYAGCRFRSSLRGRQVQGTFPGVISPQSVHGGRVHPLIPAMDELHVVLAGAGVTLRFGGDLVEVEDQRNWTDASFKAYAMPLGDGSPRSARAGVEIVQELSLSVDASKRTRLPTRPAQTVEVTIAAEEGGIVPAIGVGVPTLATPSERQVQLLQLLAPSHLRAEVLTAAPDAAGRLSAARTWAERLGSSIELAMTCGSDPAGEVAALAGVISPLRLARVLLHSMTSLTTPAGLATVVSRQFDLGVPVFGGTDAHFALLNSVQPPVDGMDGITWPLNPQTHDRDDRALFETLPIQAETVSAARRLYPGARLVVSPITLLERFSFDAGETADVEPHAALALRLPSTADSRQSTILCAAWLAGSLCNLASTGLEAITYFEAIGWRGLVQDPRAGPPLGYPSGATWAFPAFHVLADVAPHSGRRLLRASSTHSGTVDALAFLTPTGWRALISNLTASERSVRVFTSVEPRKGSLRRLNERTAVEAAAEPEHFRAATTAVTIPLTLRLKPYEVATVDVEGPPPPTA